MATDTENVRISALLNINFEPSVKPVPNACRISKESRHTDFALAGGASATAASAVSKRNVNVSCK
jgi:hypothetical protein